MDESFIAVPPEVLVPWVVDPANWRRWWPDVQLTVFMDRGIEGMRWSMAGSLAGSCEIWLESVLDGTVVHYYLRGVPTDRDGSPQPLPDTPAGWRRAARLRRARALAWKRDIWALKDLAEGRRRAGEPPSDMHRGTAGQ